MIFPINLSNNLCHLQLLLMNLRYSELRIIHSDRLTACILIHDFNWAIWVLDNFSFLKHLAENVCSSFVALCFSIYFLKLWFKLFYFGITQQIDDFLGFFLFIFCFKHCLCSTTFRASFKKMDTNSLRLLRYKFIVNKITDLVESM